MSIKLMSQVWDLDLPCDQVLVLLALTDHAHDDGSHCYPSVASLAWKVGKTERAVQYTLAALRLAGILEVKGSLSTGRGRPTHYHIHLEKASQKPPYSPASRPQWVKPVPSFPPEPGNPRGEIKSTKDETGNPRGESTCTPTVTRNRKESSDSGIPTVIPEGGVGETITAVVESSEKETAFKIFAAYRTRILPAARICPDDKIRRRLKTFSEAELLAGIEHFASDSWWMAHNASRGAAWFFHSDARSEQFLNMVPRVEVPRSSAPVLTYDPLTQWPNGRPFDPGSTPESRAQLRKITEEAIARSRPGGNGRV